MRTGIPNDSRNSLLRIIGISNIIKFKPFLKSFKYASFNRHLWLHFLHLKSNPYSGRDGIAGHNPYIYLKDHY
jgi:hypothetical protein